MNKRVKKLWVDSLKSGKYKKGRLNLRTDRSHFCCLGVLCDLYKKEKGEGKWKGHNDIFAFKLNGMHTAGLPLEVQKWARLDDTLPTAGQYLLSTINDAEGGWMYTFDQIADIINKEL